jgi:glycosyltransferase involved in cell wall biosynthesis
MCLHDKAVTNIVNNDFGASVRICYFGDAGSIHTVKWVKYFADNGHKVLLFSYRPLENGNAANIDLHLLKEPKFPIKVISFAINTLLDTIRIRRAIKEFNPDLVHSHYVTSYGWLGFLSGLHPFVVTAWGSDILVTPEKSWSARVATKCVLRACDLITCDAEHIKTPLMELGARSDKINTIYFGIDIQKFKPGLRDEKLCAELGISESPVIISLRSLHPMYDIDSLIASIPLVLKEVPEAKFVIAGEGSEKERLKELAKSLGIWGSVRFLGLIPNDDLPKYLVSSDIYVSTSLSDAGLAASTAEAMACGLPVIVTDFGDNRNWVEDNVNGYIIPLKSPEALASKIIHLLHDREIRERFGRLNRQIIEDKNNWEKEMGKMEKIYEELIERCKK